MPPDETAQSACVHIQAVGVLADDLPAQAGELASLVIAYGENIKGASVVIPVLGRLIPLKNAQIKRFGHDFRVQIRCNSLQAAGKTKNSKPPEIFSSALA